MDINNLLQKLKPISGPYHNKKFLPFDVFRYVHVLDNIANRKQYMKHKELFVRQTGRTTKRVVEGLLELLESNEDYVIFVAHRSSMANRMRHMFLSFLDQINEYYYPLRTDVYSFEQSDEYLHGLSPNVPIILDHQMP